MGFVIFGAGGGIGSEVVRLLAGAGCPVMAVGRKLPGLESVANCRSVDATDFDAVEGTLSEAHSLFGGVKGVVNCAGSLILKPAHLTSRSELEATLAANLVTAFAVVRAGARRMQEQGGSIVLMSSAAASLGLANHEAIAAAKAGVEGLVRSAAATYASWNVRINAVAPGLVDTPLATPVTSRPASFQAASKLHPLGRVGSALEVARAVVFLFEQSWLTGQVLGVDGGLARVRSR